MLKKSSTVIWKKVTSANLTNTRSMRTMFSTYLFLLLSKKRVQHLYELFGIVQPNLTENLSTQRLCQPQIACNPCSKSSCVFASFHLLLCLTYQRCFSKSDWIRKIDVTIVSHSMAKIMNGLLCCSEIAHLRTAHRWLFKKIADFTELNSLKLWKLWITAATWTMGQTVEKLRR